MNQYYILDNNIIEEKQLVVDNWTNDEFLHYSNDDLLIEGAGKNADQLWNDIEELIQDYYEIFSIYGDPIHSLISYIPQNIETARKILQNYNYTLIIF